MKELSLAYLQTICLVTISNIVLNTYSICSNEDKSFAQYYSSLTDVFSDFKIQYIEHFIGSKENYRNKMKEAIVIG